LDWFDAHAHDRVPDVQASLNTIKPDLVLGADIVSRLSHVASRTFSPLTPCAQLYHPDLIAPFLATLNIALEATGSPEDGTAYVALTVRSADLLNSFLLALRASKSAVLVDQSTYGFRFSAEHNLSAEELLRFDRSCSLIFLEQSEGADQEVRIFKIIRHLG